MLTFDGITRFTAKDVAPGESLGRSIPFAKSSIQAPEGTRTFDGKTRDGATTYDSTGAYMVGELERLDMTLNLPMVDITYGRDVDERTDVTLADDFSSFTNSTVSSQSGLGTGNTVGSGKAWMNSKSTQIATVGLDISKTPQALNVWAMEVSYSIFELLSSAQLGRPVDSQKVDAMELKRQMDIDEMVYYGDIPLNIGGLYNSAAITNVTNVPAGASGFTQWVYKTPDEILADINAGIYSAWYATGFSVKPNRILLPPAQFGLISFAKVATASGLISIKAYVEKYNLLGEGQLTIESCKWGMGAGSGGTILTPGTVDRMVTYTKNYKFLRFPKTTQARTPIQYEGIWHKWYYYHKMAGMEFPYPNTVSLQDGI
jgi:hypothetical protein